MNTKLIIVGGVSYTDEEKIFASKIQESFTIKPPLESAKEIAAFQPGKVTTSSTDVGDVSWTVPTAGITAATHVPGTASHTWQVVATSSTGIGIKGMMVAAKTLALSAYDIFKDPSIVNKAQSEFTKLRGDNFAYEALIGDRKPPLDFRDK
jgi:aminobenzoyl-glutamate utilization protein B